MPSNALVLVDTLFDRFRGDHHPGLDNSEAFELFASEQVLKSRGLSPDELQSGIVGGGNDGGIDGVFSFLGDQLLADDVALIDDPSDLSNIPRDATLELHLIQAKRSPSFSESVVDAISSSTARLLDLQQSESQLRELYSEQLVAQFRLFRNALTTLATRHPRVRIYCHYASRGDRRTVNKKVDKKAADLCTQLNEVATGASAEFVFWGASQLLEAASTSPNYTLQLVFQENATSSTSHVAIVKLRDYLNFVSNDDGSLKRHIFDWNVRDFQGSVKVNKEIRSSLEDPDSPDFWWLNNGVTIVCSRASIHGKTYTLDDVQIVNGLQTSYTIYDALANSQDDHPALDRSVLVRILDTEDDAIRDRIIRATNSQTSVPEASLRATDHIQRQIEMFFANKGWFYDRRKNYYKNLGKPINRIVGIPLLAQSVMATGLSRPNDARARPSSLLKNDETYDQIFSSEVNLEVYWWVAKLQKVVDTFLQNPQLNTSNSDRTNFRFHIAMLCVARLFGSRVHSPAQLNEIAASAEMPSESHLLTLLSTVASTMYHLVETTGETPEQIAKGRPFVEALLDAEGFNGPPVPTGSRAGIAT